MKSLMALVFALLVLLPQRGFCQSFVEVNSLKGIHQISSVSVSFFEMASSKGSMLLKSSQLLKVGRDLEAQIKGNLRASNIAVVDSPQMTPDTGQLSISVFVLSDHPNRHSFVAFCRLGQQMTLVRTGKSSYANTYESQSVGSLSNDTAILNRAVIGLANHFARDYAGANPGVSKSAKK